MNTEKLIKAGVRMAYTIGKFRGMAESEGALSVRTMLELERAETVANNAFMSVMKEHYRKLDEHEKENS